VNREVLFFIAPDSFKPDTSKYRFCEAFDGRKVAVEEVRSLSDYRGILYYFYNVDCFSSYVSSALLKIVEEGLCSFYFQAKTVVGCNRALVSRCVKKFSPEAVKLSSLKEMVLSLGLSESEATIVEALLGLREVPYQYLLKEGTDYSKIFSLLSVAYINQGTLTQVKRSVWQKVKWIFSQPFFKANRYTLLYLWRHIYGP